MKVVVWIGLLLGIAYALSNVSSCGESGAGGSAPHAFTGCSASKRAIEARLRSPGSAKWGDCSSTTSNDMQTVTLTVDSQNGFGALVRSQWVTKVRNNVVESVTQVR